MAQIAQLATSSLSNQSLASELLCHTLTNTSRIREIQVNLFADQVAGAGDYTAWITVQRAGAGSAYESARMTKTALSGTTSVMFTSSWFTINSTDVVKVYLLGLAGDTTTPDIVTDINEKYLDDTGASFTSIPNSAGVTTILADYARRTGDYATASALSTLQGNVTTILADYARRTGDYSVYAGGDTSGVTTLLARIVGTLLAGNHNPQSGDAYGKVDTEIASLQSDLTAVKAKTDSLTFTKAGEVDANIQSVNDTTVQGNGGSTKWGPA